MGVAYVIKKPTSAKEINSVGVCCLVGTAIKTAVFFFLVCLSVVVLLVWWRVVRDELWRYQSEHSCLHEISV